MALADEGRDVLMIVQSTDGFEGEVDAALLALSAAEHPGSVTTMVITSFPETTSDIWAELVSPYGGQLVLDRARASAYLFPAIAPGTSLSAAREVVSEQHRTLAERAERLLVAYQAEDPEFSELTARKEETAVRLLHYLCQPFQVTEPFSGRPGEWVSEDELLEQVAAILGEMDQ